MGNITGGLQLGRIFLRRPCIEQGRVLLILHRQDGKVVFVQHLAQGTLIGGEVAGWSGRQWATVPDGEDEFQIGLEGNITFGAGPVPLVQKD